MPDHTLVIPLGSASIPERPPVTPLGHRLRNRASVLEGAVSLAAFEMRKLFDLKQGKIAIFCAGWMENNAWCSKVMARNHGGKWDAFGPVIYQNCRFHWLS